MKLIIYFFLLISLIISLNFSVVAQNEKVALATARTEKAIQVFSQFAALGTDSVPFQLFKKAKAVAVFGEIEKNNGFMKMNYLSKFIKGYGLLTFREEKEWSVPTFLSCAGMKMGNFQLSKEKQIGAVFLFMNDNSIEIIKKGNIRGDKITGDQFALGPLVKGKVSDLTIEKAAILYYTFEDNKLSGDELKNTKIGDNLRILHDDELNKLIYGKKYKAILSEQPNSPKILELEKLRQMISDSFAQ